jgi:hypothetical protein
MDGWPDSGQNFSGHVIIPETEDIDPQVTSYPKSAWELVPEEEEDIPDERAATATTANATVPGTGAAATRPTA